MSVHSQRIHGFELKAHHTGALDGDAPLVVLVHGMAEPADVWAPVVTQLADQCHCVALDLPWNGQQGGFWGQAASPEAWLAMALHTFGLQPDAWVAHSFGASALLAFLAENHNAKEKAPAVLISPFYKASHEDVTWPLFQRYVTEFTAFVEHSIRVRLNRAIDSQVLHRMTEAARDAFGCYVWMEFWRLFSRTPFLSLEHLVQPILALTGAEDFSSPLPDVETLAAALPNARLEVFPDYGHFLLSSCAEEVSRAISAFLLAECRPEAFSETYA